MEYEDQWPVVIDNASAMMKAGFGGDDSPRAVFPTIVGRPRGLGQKDSYVGDESTSKCGILTLMRPVKGGIIENFDDMERIWHHTFYNELRVAPEEHKVLMTEAVNNTRALREKSTQIMFEEFNVPALHVETPPVLSVYGSGRYTGMSMDFGAHTTWTAGVSEGKLLRQTVNLVPMGGIQIFETSTDFPIGQTLIDYNMKILTERGYSFTTSAEREIVRDIMEKLCQVSFDFDEDMRISATSSELETLYELPCGLMLTIGNERFRCPEALFRPAFCSENFEPRYPHTAREGMATLMAFMNGYSNKASTASILPRDVMKPILNQAWENIPFGIDSAVVDSIRRSPIDLKKDMFGHIVLGGGPSMFIGLTSRLEKEIRHLAPSNIKVNVFAKPERKYLTWIGGSIIAASNVFKVTATSKELYDEMGPHNITFQEDQRANWEAAMAGDGC